MLKDTLRKILLRALIWTEKRHTPAVREKLPFWSREIHIPPLLIVSITVLMIFVLLLLETDPTAARILGIIMFLAASVMLFLEYFRKGSKELAGDNDAAMLLGLLAILSVITINIVKLTPWLSPMIVPISGMAVLAALLLNRHTAIILTITASFIFLLINEFRAEYMFFHILGSLVAILAQEKIKHRQDIIYAGLKVSLANIVSVISLTALGYMPAGSLADNLLWSIGNGLVLIMVVLIMLSPLEVFFSRITNIKLLELSDFNQPLLKRLIMEAPGTYHHSLTVASIAEQAGESVNANTLLLRVGAYYHDIGKLVKPEYFIENQIATGNPHDAISASMSGLVVISHIKEGVNLSRKHNLDKPIIDLIEQHHGTSLMYSLYQKSLEQGDKLSEDNFRYPGPMPKTRESAILMLADSCEAASRTLDEATPGKLKNLVEKIINNKFTDGQMADSPLTLSDLNKIAQSMVESLSSIYHARLEYESAEKAPQAKPKNKTNGNE